MTVKDEEANIVACLTPIFDLFAKVVVVDTGSTDATREVLRDHFGIEAVAAGLEPSQCLSLSKVRNCGFDRLATPWLLTLDADERIDRDELQAVIALDDADLPAGLFCAWETDFGDGAVVEDYKLALFRDAHRHHGLIHDTAQPGLREAGASACWSPRVRIRHFPDAARTMEKEVQYAWRLTCARMRDPAWLRYHWFSGYMAYRQGRLGEAEDLMRRVHDQRPPMFPVESLNASMILAAIHARHGRRDETKAVLEDALRHHDDVRDDFEVRVNFRLRPWLEHAAGLAGRGDLDAIVPYLFPY